MDLNTVTLIGRATKDTELKKTQDGKSITTVTLAVNNSKDRVSFFDVVLFDKTAEIAAQYVAKGKQLAVTGKLQQRRWEDKDGNARYNVEIYCQSLQLLGSKSDNHSDQPISQFNALNEAKNSDIAPEFDDKPIDLSKIPF